LSTEIAPELVDRRQRRKAETRLRLLDAASRLFAERGFEATRPQDIAREADVAVGTFYLHFADRRDAFVAFTARAAEELMERARERVVERASFEERLRSYLECLLDYADEKPGVVRAAFADESVIGAGPGAPGQSLRERLATALARGLRAGMQRGEFRSDYDALLVSHAIVGLIQQALQHGSQRQLDRDVVLDQITRFCARALVPPSPGASTGANAKSGARDRARDRDRRSP
jgi:AcrR family transcriptional regulator